MLISEGGVHRVFVRPPPRREAWTEWTDMHATIRKTAPMPCSVQFARARGAQLPEAGVRDRLACARISGPPRQSLSPLSEIHDRAITITVRCTSRFTYGLQQSQTTPQTLSATPPCLQFPQTSPPHTAHFMRCSMHTMLWQLHCTMHVEQTMHPHAHATLSSVQSGTGHSPQRRLVGCSQYTQPMAFMCRWCELLTL